MALLNTDLFVVQRPTDAGKHFKLTGDALKSFIAGGETINYKGSRDFRQQVQDPSTDGTGVQNGDLYINNNPVKGAGAWAANINGIEVEQGDRAIWNEGQNQWDLIKSDTGDHGVEEVIGIQPITVDDSIPESPQVGVYEALATDASFSAPRATRSGVVSAIASASDIASNPGTASPNPDAVVPAELLKAVNENIDSIDARVTINEGDISDIKQDITDINTEIDGINLEIENITNGGALSALKGEDPIVVATELVDDTLNPGDPGYGETETTVSIKDATTIQKGAVQLQETGSAVSSSTTVAATPGYVDTYYLIKNFSSFTEA